jgi:hypothetical protein
MLQAMNFVICNYVKITTSAGMTCIRGGQNGARACHRCGSSKLPVKIIFR